MLKPIRSESLFKAVWSHDASVALIDIMEGLLDEAEDPAKKRAVFWKANEKLKSMGFTGYTSLQCKQKWKNLVRTYRVNKDITNKPRGQCRFYFFDRMEEVYGKKFQPDIKHTLESNENVPAEVQTGPITKQELQDPISNDEDSFEENNKLHTITIIPEEDEQMEFAENNDTETIIIEGLNKSSWSYEASMAILDIMENFLDDFAHPGKRKHIFTNVNEHMISMGFEGFTPLQCQHKWKNLLRTYRANKGQMRRNSTRFHFFDRMERLLGETPEIAEQPIVKADVTEKIEIPAVSEEKQCTVTTCGHEEARENGKQKRHDERIAVAKEKLRLEKLKLQLERRKINLLETILAKLA